MTTPEITPRAEDAERPATLDPLQVLDWCDTCTPIAVVVYDGETCGCCGREWGTEARADGSSITCRGVHIEGWAAAVDEYDQHAGA